MSSPRLAVDGGPSPCVDGTMRRTTARPLALALALAGGCVGDDASTSSASTDSASTSATSSASESGASQSSTSAGTSAGSESATSDTTTSGDTTSTATSSGSATSDATSSESSTTGPGVDCPAPEEVSADFSFSGPDQVDAATCVVTATDITPPAGAISLECAGEAYTLTYTLDPFGGPELAVDQEVILDYRTDPIFWTNRWISLRSGDFTVFGGVSSSALDPPGTTIAAFFGEPVLTELGGLCEPIDGGCGPEERLALEMSYKGSAQLILDHGVGYFNNLAEAIHLNLEVARTTPQTTCDDYPEAWYQLVFVWHSSD